VQTDAFQNSLRTGLVSALAFAALSSTASAQVDYSVNSIEVNQAIQLGNTPLVGGKPTMVRATIDVVGVTADADGIMRVYDGGVEVANSPVYSDNGPFPAPLVPSNGDPDGTLNFTFIPPTSGNVTITIEINPAGPNHVIETDGSNNMLTTATLNFQNQRVPELAYANVDLDPSGGGAPNPAPTNLIMPSVGDNFIHGIFPSSDWFYHRTDAPTKLWTLSVASSGGGSQLVSSLAVDRQLMVPIPDYIYGWINGGISYNGVSTIGGPASMGNTQSFKHQRTFAHEIGHNFGLSHNSTKLNTVGVDVERQLNITEALPLLKSPTLNDIMVPGLNTVQAWVASNSYNFFFNHPTFNGADSDEATTSDEKRILVAGMWNKATGAIEVTDTFTFTGGELTTAVSEAEAELVVKTYRGGKLSQVHPIAVRSSLDECGCSESQTDSLEKADPLIGFLAVLPANVEGQAAIDRITVVDPSKKLAVGHNASRTQFAPEASFITPSGDAVEGKINVSWQGSDQDGDELSYYLRYSPNNDGSRMVPLLGPTKSTEFSVDLREIPAFVDGEGHFELMVSDGLNTTTVQSMPLFSSADGVGGNPPWIEVLTPDSAMRFAFGATVVLRSSGWDLEDRKIQGASIEWSSNVDGFIGTGRVLSVNTLSPGTHVLTAQATDSDGMVSMDSTTIGVAPRLLPDSSDCQPNLGFGGPGSSVLMVCGGDLSTGTTFDVTLTGALPSTQGWIMGGPTNNPIAALGGMIVPNPTPVFAPFNTDTNGDFSAMGLNGGGGPATFYIQVLYLDGAQVGGVGFSNAVQMNFLP
jgi:hypothetical protein